MASHSAARLDNRALLAILTAVHHLASAAWIGSMPYLLIALRHAPPDAAAVMTSRFSRLAMASVAALVAAGAVLSYSYVGTPSALTGTTYGVMLASKIGLTVLLLALGGLNFKIVQAVRRGLPAEMLPLRRFAEAEVGIGFTILLAAASLTSTPPAIDVVGDRVSPPEIWARMSPGWPRMNTPALAELSPATPLQSTLNATAAGSFVPGQLLQPNSPADIAWSEYNHHWAGLVRVGDRPCIRMAVRFRWARNWPLLFLGLALFLLIRADSENWPLGPRGFWESFQVAEVAQHRLFVLLIVAFAAFEWCVQTRKALTSPRGACLSRRVCRRRSTAPDPLPFARKHEGGVSGGVEPYPDRHPCRYLRAGPAGWRMRVPQQSKRVLSWIWPVCFILIGALLLNYREA